MLSFSNSHLVGNRDVDLRRRAIKSRADGFDPVTLIQSSTWRGTSAAGSSWRWSWWLAQLGSSRVRLSSLNLTKKKKKTTDQKKKKGALMWSSAVQTVNWAQPWKRGLCFTFPLVLQRLSLVQLQANELLHALPVLHLSGAVGVILTWLAVGALRLPHLLVHLRQPQPEEEEEEEGRAMKIQSI